MPLRTQGLYPPTLYALMRGHRYWMGGEHWLFGATGCLLGCVDGRGGNLPIQQDQRLKCEGRHPSEWGPPAVSPSVEGAWLLSTIGAACGDGSGDGLTKTSAVPCLSDDSAIVLVKLHETVTRNRRKGRFARMWRADENDDDGERKDRGSAGGR
jgi:hypothetical protein